MNLPESKPDTLVIFKQRRREYQKYKNKTDTKLKPTNMWLVLLVVGIGFFAVDIQTNCLRALPNNFGGCRTSCVCNLQNVSIDIPF